MAEPAGRSSTLLYVLGPGLPSEESLRAAVSLAQRLSAELHALFVEDEELLQAAELPIVRRVRRESGVKEPLDVSGVLSEWRALSAAAQRTLASEAEKRSARLRFEVLRGKNQHDVDRACAARDLVVLAAGRAPVTASARLGRALAPPGPRVRVFYEGGPEDEALLGVASILAGGAHGLEAWAPWNIELTRNGVLRALAAVGGGILVLAAATPLARFLVSMNRKQTLPCWIVLARAHGASAQ